MNVNQKAREEQKEAEEQDRQAQREAEEEFEATKLSVLIEEKVSSWRSLGVFKEKSGK